MECFTVASCETWWAALVAKERALQEQPLLLFLEHRLARHQTRCLSRLSSSLVTAAGKMPRTRSHFADQHLER